jgi:hypothetical protein
MDQVGVDLTGYDSDAVCLPGPLIPFPAFLWKAGSTLLRVLLAGETGKDAKGFLVHDYRFYTCRLSAIQKRQPAHRPAAKPTLFLPHPLMIRDKQQRQGWNARV